MSRVEVARLSSRQQAEELRFTLDAIGIEAWLHEVALDAPAPASGSPGVVFVLLVEEKKESAARQVVAEELAGPAAVSSQPAPEAVPGALAVTLALMLVLVLVFIAEELLGGSQSGATLIRFGASHGPRVLQAGEWWRTVCAAFLHIGAQHLLANLASLFVLGALSRARFGPGKLLLIWLASAVAGNWVSLALSSGPMLRAGASGGIFGLFGALAGARLRQLHAPRPASRFKRWHVAAATLAFLALTVGTGPTDYPAHLGGLLGGGLLGFLLVQPDAARARGRLLELLLGALATGLALSAGWLAWRAG